MTPSEKAATILKARNTKDLIDDFVFTSKLNNSNVPTVRGWIMDELERRNPEAFAKWIDFNGTDWSPHYFFDC